MTQTSDRYIGLKVLKSKGIFIYDTSGKKYMDMISGISVSNLGYKSKFIKKYISKQSDLHDYTMVYGQYLQLPQIKLAQKLVDILPQKLNKVYFQTTGTEAIEGSLKVAKKFTGRPKILAFKNSYHGSSYGSKSLMYSHDHHQAFSPMMPGVFYGEFNNVNSLSQIDDLTAAVILEPIQSEAGIRIPTRAFFEALKEKCRQHRVLIIFDENQTGIGRSGKMFAFENFHITPDILVIGKAFGGGMPLSAFVSDKKIMDSLKQNPPLGHLTTFGGHPISCAAALGSFKYFEKKNLLQKIEKKSALLKCLLTKFSVNFSDIINGIRGMGMMWVIEFKTSHLAREIMKKNLDAGVITDGFLFCNKSVRIYPPLTIKKQEIIKAFDIMERVLKNKEDENNQGK